MVNICINGLNAKIGGGKSILNNYLSLLTTSDSQFNYFVLTPNAEEYKKYETNNITIVEISDIYLKNLLYPLIYSIVLPQMLKKLKINAVFNLADIPIRTSIKQIFLFDWSYAVYPESFVWQMMDFKSKIIRKAKLFFFKRYLKYIDVMIAQTDTMKKRLFDLYGISNIVVIPNAVSGENLSGGVPKEFDLPDGIKLLYLTHYYPHKNLEIFIPLAQEIKKRGLHYKLITTIESKQHLNAKKFIEEIDSLNLKNIIHNIGAVDMQYVPSLYKQCDALLMPTLLESFSGTYVEAMYHKIPIFTSNIDFAKGVCKEAGVYFDPFCVASILDSIQTVFQNENLKKSKISYGTKVLNQLPNWEKTFTKYKKIIENEISR